MGVYVEKKRSVLDHWTTEGVNNGKMSFLV